MSVNMLYHNAELLTLSVMGYVNSFDYFEMSVAIFA